MYSGRFIMSVVAGGRVLAERKDGTVPIPFDSEYLLRFRNRHDRRAVVRFTIDGEDVSGNGYVIPARCAIDIQRHHSHDAAFRFVSLDSEDAAAYGKSENVQGEKGVIEARFFLEKAAPVLQHIHHYHEYPSYPPPYSPWQPWTPRPYYGMSARSARGSSMGQVGQSIPTAYNNPSQVPADLRGIVTPDSSFDVPLAAPSGPLAEGCTVDGGTSGQRFGSTWIDVETDSVTLRLVLRGYTPTPEQVAESAFAAEPQKHCTGCGAKRHRKNDRFCGACGQRL